MERWGSSGRPSRHLRGRRSHDDLASRLPPKDSLAPRPTSARPRLTAVPVPGPACARRVENPSDRPACRLTAVRPRRRLEEPSVAHHVRQGKPGCPRAVVTNRRNHVAAHWQTRQISNQSPVGRLPWREVDRVPAWPRMLAATSVLLEAGLPLHRALLSCDCMCRTSSLPLPTGRGASRLGTSPPRQGTWRR